MPYRDTELSDEARGKLKQFYRLLMSYNDFKQANQIAERILEEKLHDNIAKNRVLIEALNCAMIVAYARPFSGNDQKVEVRISDLPENFLKDLSCEEKELHKVVIEDRNKVLAHSDSDAHKLRPQAWVLNGEKVLMSWSSGTKAPLTEEAAKSFAALSEKLRERAYERRMELEQELLGYFDEVQIEDIAETDCEENV
ncbi:MAG: hypothetical protein K8R68_12265 [Bacteroidales bacterium]|nr:hypothetical protein [Bacteroidales bacterium]